MKPAFLILSCIIVFLLPYCYAEKRGFDPLYELIRGKRSREWFDTKSATWDAKEVSSSPVYLSSQVGFKEADKIKSLPGQPEVKFNQYSGYVTVDPKAGRALFYYFVESPINPSAKPLLLWLNGGPGCSSFGNGAMLELGPFRVDSNGETLYANEYAWNKVANVIFLESPAGVGFSYSNTTSDYEKSGDTRTAQDSYTFLINWLERFPEYKNRDFFIAGESYAGHYVPQLAQTILQRNKATTKQTLINLRGITIGNALIEDETTIKGMYDFFWTHALISDEVIDGIRSNCNFSNSDGNASDTCLKFQDKADAALSDIYLYNIYAPLCSSSSNEASKHEIFDPCSSKYVAKYLNNPQVQRALHANVTSLPFPWSACSSVIEKWNDAPDTVIPIIKELMAGGISVWIYSGDTDGRIPVTSTRYSINLMTPSIVTPWYPWYSEGQIGGYAIGYKNLTFVTVRGAGHLVPSYQPARALTLVLSFLEGKLPPTIS